MADLDDFFAKKDRKKSKSKKFATTEEVAKKLDDTSKKQVVKKERTQEGEDGNVPEHEQDEWKEFEEEKKDYTGLKIGNLTINSAEGSTGNTENFSEQNEGDMVGSDSEKKTGPWKRIASEVQDAEVEKPIEPPPVSVTVSSSAPPSTYVPPSMRNQQHQQHQPMQSSRLKTKAAPDIHNEEYFPSLSTTKSDQRKTRNEGSFEVVAHSRSSSVRQAEQNKLSSTQGPKLNLGNRYNTLSNDS